MISSNQTDTVAVTFEVLRPVSHEVVLSLVHELAEALGCSPSKISRLESGNDEQLKWPDIVGYTKALNLSMEIKFSPREELPVAAQIKRDVFAVSDRLEDLVKLAEKVNDDKVIIDKINTFMGEVLLNFLRKFGDHYSRFEEVLKVNQTEAEDNRTWIETDAARAEQQCEATA